MPLPKSCCCKKSWSLLTGSKIISTSYLICTAAVISGLICISVDEATFRSLSKMQLSDYLMIGKSLFPQAAYIDSTRFQSNNFGYSSSAITKKKKSEKMIATNSIPTIAQEMKKGKSPSTMGQESSSTTDITSDLVIRTAASNSVKTGEGNQEKTKTTEERKHYGDSISSTALVSISFVDTLISPTNTISKMDEYQTITTSDVKGSTQTELSITLGSTVAPSHITEIGLRTVVTSTTTPDSIKATQLSTKKEYLNSDPVSRRDATRTTIGSKKIRIKNTTTKKRKGKLDFSLFGGPEPGDHRRRRRSAITNNSSKIKHNNRDNSDFIFNIILIPALVFHGIYFGACVLLLIGISKRSSGFVGPWLLAEFLRQLAVLAIWIFLCYYTVDILNKDPEDAKFAITFCAAILIVIVLTFYFWLVIGSFFKELHAKRYEIRPEKKDKDPTDQKQTLDSFI